MGVWPGDGFSVRRLETDIFRYPGANEFEQTVRTGHDPVPNISNRMVTRFYIQTRNRSNLRGIAEQEYCGNESALP